MPEPPKVFISYSHDSDEHAERVLALADQLTEDGLDVILDQYDPNPDVGWPLWMETHLDAADFVLMVCTETYHRRVMRKEAAGKGLGVQWEGSLIYNRIYNNPSQGSRFIPVLFEGGGVAHIPGPVQGHTRYELREFGFDDRGYERLYRHLTGQHDTPRPERGTIRELPTRARGKPSTNPPQPPGV
jgi:hypothetical protein